MSLHDDVRAEVEGLHEFFVAWFSGAVPREHATFHEGLTRRLADGFALIPPAGTWLAGGDLEDAVYRAHGSNPGFRIAIRRVQLRADDAGLVVATYQEWQRNARASTPPDNGRAATAVFRRSESGLRWVHVHETWLPAEVMAAGPFDF